MATVQTIIDRALRLLSQPSSGRSATTEETADALVVLNDMLDSWRNEKLMAWSMQTESVPMVSTRSSYSIGPTGTDVVTVRPEAIENAWVEVGTSSYDIVEMTEDEYATLRSKASAAEWPERYLFRASMPNATLIVYPVPNAATATLKIVTRVPFTAFAAATDTVSLPPGWKAALTFNLAVEMAPEFETEAKASTVQKAVTTKAAIKRSNHRVSHLTTELGYLFSRSAGNIITG